MMNKEFADTDQIDIAVKAEETVHEPDHLEKLVKQNQETLEMMRYLIKMLAGKAAHKACALRIRCKHKPNGFFFDSVLPGGSKAEEWFQTFY